MKRFSVKVLKWLKGYEEVETPDGYVFFKDQLRAPLKKWSVSACGSENQEEIA